MYKFHEVCGENVFVSQDRTIGQGMRGSNASGILFSNSPLTAGQPFLVRVSDGFFAFGYLPVCVGVTTVDPASRSLLPDCAWDLTGSWLVTPGTGLYKDGELTEERSDLKLVRRMFTGIGLTLSETGSVTVTQDGVAVGDLCQGLVHPLWAVVQPCYGTSVYIVNQVNPRLQPSPNQYKMNANPRGYAVIVNISRVIGLPELHGAEHDVNRLREVFTKLHFTPIITNNISAEDIKTFLKKLSKDKALADHDCFALILLSHGGNGYVLGADGGQVDLKKTFWLFSNDGCPALRGKPKLFFIDACRGSTTDGGVARAVIGHDRLPSISDMLVAYATTEGYTSLMTSTQGSRFAQSVADVFEQEAEKLHVLDMMTRVNKHVQEKGSSKVQGPEFKSNLNKDMYLCPSYHGSDMDSWCTIL